MPWEQDKNQEFVSHWFGAAFHINWTPTFNIMIGENKVQPNPALSASR